MINKKITIGVLLLVISLLLINIPTSHTETVNPINPQVEVLQGKITVNGILFIIQEKQPAGNSYNPISNGITAHDPNFKITIYNPNRNINNETLEIDEYTGTGNKSINNYQNITVETPYRTIYTQSYTISMTKNTENLTMGILGSNYNLNEKYIKPPTIPFYEQGELDYLFFIMGMSAVVLFISFFIALGLLKRGKYFPRIKAPVLILMIIGLGMAAEPIISTNYYEIIQTRWEEYFIPLFIISLLIFLSYIPNKTQKGLLLRFLGDKGNDEVRTQFLVITTSEIELIENEKMRHSGMEYINTKSYMDFFKRIFGFHIPIFFEKGELPNEIEKPENLKNIKKQRRFYFKNVFKLRNTKQKANDFDFGYLLDRDTNPRIEKIEEIKNDLTPDETVMTEETQKKGLKKLWTRIRKYKIFYIPISGHHSRQIEEFLAGLHESELKGKQIDVLTTENAELKAQIQAKTYYSATDIIDELGLESGISKEEFKEDKKEISGDEKQ